LKQALADKVLEGEFLRGALRKVEERRRGETGVFIPVSSRMVKNLKREINSLLQAV